MGCFDVYCALCGVRLNGGMFRDVAKEPAKLRMIATTRWMERCTVLVPRRAAQHGFRETACNCTFEGRGRAYALDNYVARVNKKTRCDAMEGVGLAVHTDCWRAARKAMNGRGLTLDHFDLRKLRTLHKTPHSYLLTHLAYGPAAKYNKTQHFANDDIENIKEIDRYILVSPMGTSAAAKKNAARVAANARKLLQGAATSSQSSSARTPRRAAGPARPSPSQKAREFKNQTRKGNDGKTWRSKRCANGVYRWVRA